MANRTRKDVIKQDAKKGASIGAASGLLLGGASIPVLASNGTIAKLIRNNSPAKVTAGAMGLMAGSTLAGAGLGGITGLGIGATRKYNPRYKVDKKKVERERRKNERIVTNMDKDIGKGVLIGLGTGALLGAGRFALKSRPYWQDPAVPKMSLLKPGAIHTLNAAGVGSTLGGTVGLGYYYIKPHNRRGKTVKGYSRKKKAL